MERETLQKAKYYAQRVVREGEVTIVTYFLQMQDNHVAGYVVEITPDPDGLPMESNGRELSFGEIEVEDDEWISLPVGLLTSSLPSRFQEV